MLFWLVTGFETLIGTLLAAFSFIALLPVMVVRAALRRSPAELLLTAAAFVGSGVWLWLDWTAREAAREAEMRRVAALPPPLVAERRVDPVSGCHYSVPLHGFGLLPVYGPDGRPVCVPPMAAGR